MCRKLLCLYLLAYIYVAQALLGIPCTQLYFAGERPASRSKIIILVNSGGARFLLKQRLGDEFKDQFMGVLDTLGALIAESVNVPCNHVELISVHDCLTHKLFKNRPATLHTFVPGCLPTKLERFKSLDIKQYYRHVSESERGLTLSVIKNMALHPQLSRIVAVDTFIGNIDRFRNNLFYNEPTDTFYAIDFGNTFKKNLCEIAKKRIKELQLHKIRLSPEELRGLILYRNTLNALLSMHPPAALSARLEQLAEKTGFFSKKSPFKDRVKEARETIREHQEFIKDSYKAAVGLRAIIDSFIAKHRQLQQPAVSLLSPTASIQEKTAPEAAAAPLVMSPKLNEHAS
jgi:hypothetical protein